MTRLIQSLAEIEDAYDALLVDLWGCYHDGLRPYEAAVRALRAFRERGGLVILLTNAPRPAAQVLRFLDRIGAPEDSWDGVMSSGTACQRAMASGEWGARFHYVGPDRDRSILGGIGLEPAPVDEASAIVCTGIEDDTRPPDGRYDETLRGWRARGLPMLCANPDIVVDRGEQRLWCAGALAELYEAAGGRVIWFGKPHDQTYRHTFALLDELAGRPVPRERILAMGDGIATDVRGALAQGLDTLFLTGGIATDETGGDPEHPDPERLAAFLAGHGLRPQYAMGRLR